MNIDSKDTPLVLLCPTWKNWGTVKTIKPNSVILHSRQDDVIPFADSEELVTSSGILPETLIEVGNDHLCRSTAAEGDVGLRAIAMKLVAGSELDTSSKRAVDCRFSTLIKR